MGNLTEQYDNDLIDQVLKGLRRGSDTLEKVPPHVAIAAVLGGKANPSRK